MTERSSLVDLLEHNVASVDDEPNALTWLLEKAKELDKMGKADVLLGAVALGVYRYNEKVTTTVAHVKDIKSIHPVGEWRPDTWAKTRKRTESILAGKELLMQNDMTLTQELTQQEEVFEPMRSIGRYIAVPFPYGGKKYVTLEGNGRLKAVALAAEQDRDFKDLKVEVDLYEFHPNSSRIIQANILKLWNQYVWEGVQASKSDDIVEEEVKAYLDFRVPIVKCRGFASEGGAICPTTIFAGGHPQHDGGSDWVESQEMVEVEYATFRQSPNILRWQEEFGAGKPLKYYKILGKDEYMVGDSVDVAVKEYCPLCLDIK